MNNCIFLLEGHERREDTGVGTQIYEGDPSGIASLGARGAECPLDSKRMVKNLGKEEKLRGKERKNRVKIEKKRKNWEEKAKIGKVLSLCPS